VNGPPSLFALRLVRDIEQKEFRGWSGLLYGGDGGPAGSFIAIRHVHVGAGSGKRLRDGSADARSGAGDERHFACKTEHVAMLNQDS
jgi:hypothetical protein